jgi:hypothetical protein
MATKIFQQLENGAHPSIKARAKFQVGEMLLEKGQHDLALQVFEDIINKNSHSGIVLAALKQAQVCAEKLGIQNKNEQENRKWIYKQKTKLNFMKFSLTKEKIQTSLASRMVLRCRLPF